MESKSIPMNFMGALCVIGLLAISVFAQPSGDPNNDLTGTLGIADPSTVVKCGGVYYTWGTGGRGLMSKDRKNWTANNNSPTKSQPWWSAHGGQMWAPDVSYMNGVYYCYYSVSAWGTYNSAIGLATSPTLDPTASNYLWTDKGCVIDSLQAADGGAMVNVIDPSTVVDDDGKWYLAFGSWQAGVRLAELNTQTGLLQNNPPHPTKVNNRGAEGAAAIHWKTYYYYAVSRSTCCKGMNSTYFIGYGRAATITGPYVTKNGGTLMTNSVETLLKGSNDPSATSGAVAVGVGGFFWDGSGGLDTLFMNYMAYTAPSGNTLLNIHPLYADATGWLTFDPTKGTIMTRTPPITSINYSVKKTSNLSFKRSYSVRMVNSAGIRPTTQFATLYSITGRQLKGNSMKGLTQGVYIEMDGVR